MVFKTVLATKIGDTVLQCEDGSFIYVYPDRRRNLYGYWQLYWGKDGWEINKFVPCDP